MSLEPEPGEPPTPPRRGFAALGVPNFRLYFAGQFVAQTGTWFQNLAIALLIVQLTGSATALSLVTVCQFGPMILLAPIAGRLADTVRPRAILIVTSAALGGTTLGLMAAVSVEEPSLLVIYGLLLLSGVAIAFERVAAQTIIYELVGGEMLESGVVLSTVYMSAARSVGPGLAGIAVITLGAPMCLLINALSYLAVLAALAFMNPARMQRRVAPEGAQLSVIANLRDASRNHALIVLLGINAFIALMVYNFNVTLTSVVTISFEAGAGELGAAHALNAIGGVVGGVLVAWLVRVKPLTIVPALVIFGVVLVANAAAPTLLLFLIVAPLLGIGLGIYQAVINSAAQAVTPPHALGRTLSLLQIGHSGLAPLGAITAGILVDLTSGQTAIAVAAAACLIAAVGAWLALRPRTERAVA